MRNNETTTLKLNCVLKLVELDSLKQKLNINVTQHINELPNLSLDFFQVYAYPEYYRKKVKVEKIEKVFLTPLTLKEAIDFEHNWEKENVEEIEEENQNQVSYNSFDKKIKFENDENILHQEIDNKIEDLLNNDTKLESIINNINNDNVIQSKDENAEKFANHLVINKPKTITISEENNVLSSNEKVSSSKSLVQDGNGEIKFTIDLDKANKNGYYNDVLDVIDKIFEKNESFKTITEIVDEILEEEKLNGNTTKN